MNITDAKVNKVADQGKVKAYGSIVFDEGFIVRGFKLIEGEKGLFVAMPSRKTASGEFKDTAHPITAEARTAVIESLLKAYEAAE